MVSTRRRFTDEYKQHAVRLVMDSGDPVAEIARNIDVLENDVEEMGEQGSARTWASSVADLLYR